MDKNINKKQNKLAGIALFMTAAVIIGTVWAADAIYKKENNTVDKGSQEQTTPLDLNSLIPEPAPNTAKSDDETAQETENVSVPEPIGSDTLNDAEQTEQVAKPDISALSNPVSSSKITMAFSYGTDPVYSRTFNEYRSDHSGIDIYAALGEEVKCALPGKVVEIRTDSKLGKTVKIEHDGGIFTEYSNLDDDIKVIVNDRITAGQTIGKVGNTALYEISDESHVHFALIINGEYTDPAAYLSF